MNHAAHPRTRRQRRQAKMVELHILIPRELRKWLRQRAKTQSVGFGKVARETLYAGRAVSTIPPEPKE